MTNDPEEHEAFVTIIETLAAFYDVQVTATRTGLYFEALRDLPLGQVEMAAVQIMRYRKTATFPKPGEFREMIELSCFPKMTAAEAWIEVQKVVQQYGGKKQTSAVLFSSDRTRIACEYVGGIDGLWRSERENAHVARAQFTKAYDALTERDRVRTFVTKEEATQSLARVYKMIEQHKKETAS